MDVPTFCEIIEIRNSYRTHTIATLLLSGLSFSVSTNLPRVKK